MVVTNLLAQSCNKADNAIKLVTSYEQLVPDLLQQTGNKQCEHNLLTACEQTCNNLFADLLQAVRFYACSSLFSRKNAEVVTSLQTNCYKSVYDLSRRCVRTACSQLL
jgi:hypothetical protein